MEIHVSIALGSKFALGSKYRFEGQENGTRLGEIPPAKYLTLIKNP